jgi:phage-related protein
MGTIKAVVGFLAIAAVVLGIFQVAPHIMANYSFQDDLKTVALMDSANFQKTEDDIKGEVVRKAKEHELPVEAKQVTVQRINTPGMSAIYVAADYSVTVNLPGYSFDMHFSPNSGNKAF